MKTPINFGRLQSDLDFAGYSPVNLTGWPPSGGGGGSGLDANTVTASDIGLVADGVTDNTAALQAWLNGVQTARVNSTLLVPDGIYIFSGSLQDGSRRNAQILLPILEALGTQYTVTIKGYHPIAASPNGPALGPIFRSTLATGSGTQPSFICGRGPIGGDYDEVSVITLCLENMIFQTVANPQISCLNLERIANVDFRGDVLIMAGSSMTIADWVQPTTTTSYGLMIPKVNNGVLQQCENVSVFNFYTGAKIGELTHMDSIALWKCYYALEFADSYHASLLERVLDWQCPYGIRVTGAHPFQVVEYDVERAAAAQWNTRIADVYDPGNLAYADITWWTVTTIVGWDNAFTVTGGLNVNTQRVGHPAAAYIGADARLVSVSGGVKLETRNTGTGVWVESARWTNP